MASIGLYQRSARRSYLIGFTQIMYDGHGVDFGEAVGLNDFGEAVGLNTDGDGEEVGGGG